MGMNGHLSNARRHVQDQSTQKKYAKILKVILKGSNKLEILVS